MPSPHLRSVTRLVRRHRRILAACAAGLAVWAIVSELRPTAPTTNVVVATRDVPAGTRLTIDDVRTAAWPMDTWPGAVTDTTAVVGRVTAVSLPLGAPVPAFSLVSPSAIARVTSSGDSEVAMGVRPTDPLISSLLSPGDRVDVWAAPQGALVDGGSGAASRVAQGVRVLGVVRDQGTASGVTAGSATATRPAGGIVVLLVPAPRAAAVARASAGEVITLALLSS